jgi:hypothetical protein
VGHVARLGLLAAGDTAKSCSYGTRATNVEAGRVAPLYRLA